MEYRRIKEEDIPRIQELALKSWLFTYRNIYSEERIRDEVAEFYSDDKMADRVMSDLAGAERFVVAEDGEDIVGYANVLEGEDGWELMRIYVDPDRIRQGIGKRLIDRIESYLKENGVDRYIAHPHSDNPLAINFYVKMGFERDPEGDRGDDSPCFRKMI